MYDQYTGYFEALVWLLLAQSVANLARIHNGWIPYLDWFYYRIDGSLPSNIYICMFAKARVGFVIVIIIGAVTFTLLFLGMIAGVIHIYFMSRHKKYMEMVQNSNGKYTGLWVRDDKTGKYHRDMTPHYEHGDPNSQSQETQSNIQSEVQSNTFIGAPIQSPDHSPKDNPQAQVVYVHVEPDPLHMVEEYGEDENDTITVKEGTLSSLGEAVDETDHLLRLTHAFIFGSPSSSDASVNHDPHFHHE